MATILREKYTDLGDYRYERDIYEVRTTDGDSFVIKAGPEKDGTPVIVRIDYRDMEIEKAARIVAGCFEKESNFFEKAREICYSGCNRKIKLEYQKVSILVSEFYATEEQIVKKWNRKAKLKKEAHYYIIGVRKLAISGKFDGICKVLATSEKEAIAKIKEGYDYCECTCFGVYNEKSNTFELQNASEYLPLKDMYTVED